MSKVSPEFRPQEPAREHQLFSSLIFQLFFYMICSVTVGRPVFILHKRGSEKELGLAK